MFWLEGKKEDTKTSAPGDQDPAQHRDVLSAARCVPVPPHRGPSVCLSSSGVFWGDDSSTRLLGTDPTSSHQHGSLGSWLLRGEQTDSGGTEGNPTSSLKPLVPPPSASQPCSPPSPGRPRLLPTQVRGPLR